MNYVDGHKTGFNPTTKKVGIMGSVEYHPKPADDSSEETTVRENLVEVTKPPGRTSVGPHLSVDERTIREETSWEGLLLRSWRGYTVESELPATGGEADIFVVRDAERRFVLKLYRKGMEPKPFVLSKVKELSERISQHVVRIYDYGYDEKLQRWYELQEYAKHGNFRDFVERRRLGDDEIDSIIGELNEALHALHSVGVVHRDLKPSNILVRSVEPLNLVFTDFGVSTVVDDEVSKRFTTFKGTPHYSAPESFTDVAGKEVDYWSLGIILYEIVVGENPFQGLSVPSIVYKLMTEGVAIPNSVGRFGNLLMGLLTRNPRKRWGYAQVKSWLAGDRTVPVYYYDELNQTSAPYRFLDEEFHSCEVLSVAFVKSERSFEEAKLHLERGYIRNWLSRNNDLERLRWIDSLLERYGSGELSPEELVVRFVYEHQRKLPLILYGRTVNFEYLENLVVLKRFGEVSGTDERIFEMMTSGTLERIVQAYGEVTGFEVGEILNFVRNVSRAASTGFYEAVSDIVVLVRNFRSRVSLPDDLAPSSKSFDPSKFSPSFTKELLSKLKLEDKVYWGDLEFSDALLASIFAKILAPPYYEEKFYNSPYLDLLRFPGSAELLVSFAGNYSRGVRLFLKTLDKLLSATSISDVSLLTNDYMALGYAPKIALVTTSLGTFETLVGPLTARGVDVLTHNPANDHSLDSVCEKYQAYDLVGFLVDDETELQSVKVELKSEKATNRFVYVTNSTELASRYSDCIYIPIPTASMAAHTDERVIDGVADFTWNALRIMAAANFVRRVAEESFAEIERRGVSELLSETEYIREELPLSIEAKVIERLKLMFSPTEPLGEYQFLERVRSILTSSLEEAFYALRNHLVSSSLKSKVALEKYLEKVADQGDRFKFTQDSSYENRLQATLMALINELGNAGVYETGLRAFCQMGRERLRRRLNILRYSLILLGLASTLFLGFTTNNPQLLLFLFFTGLLVSSLYKLFESSKVFSLKDRLALWFNRSWAAYKRSVDGLTGRLAPIVSREVRAYVEEYVLKLVRFASRFFRKDSSLT